MAPFAHRKGEGEQPTEKEKQEAVKEAEEAKAEYDKLMLEGSILLQQFLKDLFTKYLEDNHSTKNTIENTYDIYTNTYDIYTNSGSYIMFLYIFEYMRNNFGIDLFEYGFVLKNYKYKQISKYMQAKLDEFLIKNYIYKYLFENMRNDLIIGKFSIKNHDYEYKVVSTTNITDYSISFNDSSIKTIPNDSIVQIQIQKINKEDKEDKEDNVLYNISLQYSEYWNLAMKDNEEILSDGYIDLALKRSYHIATITKITKTYNKEIIENLSKYYSELSRKSNIAENERLKKN